MPTFKHEEIGRTAKRRAPAAGMVFGRQAFATAGEAFDRIEARAKKDKKLAKDWELVKACASITYSDCVSAEKAADARHEEVQGVRAELVDAQNRANALQALVTKLQLILGSVMMQADVKLTGTAIERAGMAAYFKELNCG